MEGPICYSHILLSYLLRVAARGPDPARLDAALSLSAVVSGQKDDKSEWRVNEDKDQSKSAAACCPAVEGPLMRVAHAWLCGAIPTTEVREEALVVGARAAASGVRPHILCRPYNLRFDAQTLDVARELHRIQSQRAGRKGALPLCLHVALQQPMRRSAGADVRSLHPLGKVGKGVAVRVEGESSPAPSTCWNVETVAGSRRAHHGESGEDGGRQERREGASRHVY